MEKREIPLLFRGSQLFGPGAKGQRRALAMASKLKPLGIRFGIEARVNDIHEDTVAALMEAGLESCSSAWKAAVSAVSME